MPFLDRPDGPLYYEVAGAGPPLLLVPGLGGSATYWANLVPLLSDAFQVVMHDHMGTGRSGRERTEHTVEALSADVLALLDHLDIPHASLIGHSTGAALGQILGQEHPERLDRLVLYAGWAGPDPHFALCFEARKALLTGSGIPAYHRAAPLFLYPPSWIASDPGRLDALTSGMVANSPDAETLARRVDMIVGFDRRSRMAETGVPTLVICAEDDMLTPMHLSEELASGIPGAMLSRLAWGGHSASQTAEQHFLDAVLPFLDGPSQPNLARA
jgi:aminoacrylate hydrolase